MVALAVPLITHFIKFFTTSPIYPGISLTISRLGELMRLCAVTYPTIWEPPTGRQSHKNSEIESNGAAWSNFNCDILSVYCTGRPGKAASVGNCACTGVALLFPGGIDCRLVLDTWRFGASWCSGFWLGSLSRKRLARTNTPISGFLSAILRSPKPTRIPWSPRFST